MNPEPEDQPVHSRRVDRHPTDPKPVRRLGLLEFLLLALIVLGVGITTAMAIIDPAT